MKYYHDKRNTRYTPDIERGAIGPLFVLLSMVLAFQSSINSGKISGRTLSQGPRKTKSARSSFSLGSRLNTATFPPCLCTRYAYVDAGRTCERRPHRQHRCDARTGKSIRTVEDVPITRQMSALYTMLLISSRWYGFSPNHTTPGRARAPHAGQRGSCSRGMLVSFEPASW
ncbi:hypothetical protein GSI_05330 [Ganoderma sinense ZZ0214-1]|uniref:Uncharacterized protein n=1 Tax=Ganoderma sinense ZZ0214-1 TaxID=1077348 RepID=A0A2G8SFT2_9APHY|nr:hypothetical protein GSI_05330 [Ganoderma sinense ZZ0214-1]